MFWCIAVHHQPSALEHTLKDITSNKTCALVFTSALFYYSINSILTKPRPTKETTLGKGSSAWLIHMACFCRFLADALKCVLSNFNSLWAIIPTKGLKFVREDVREAKINRLPFWLST